MVLLSKSLLTITKIQLFLCSWGFASQYKLNPTYIRFFFSINSSWIYTTPVLKFSLASNMEIIYSYTFLQFYYITNIITLVYDPSFYYYQTFHNNINTNFLFSFIRFCNFTTMFFNFIKASTNNRLWWPIFITFYLLITSTIAYYINWA